MNESTLSQRSYVSSTGYEGDTESDELIDFFKDGIIPGVIPDSSEDEVPPLTIAEAKEEEDINTQASQAVDELPLEEQRKLQKEPLGPIEEAEDEEEEASIIQQEPESKRISKQTSFFKPADFTRNKSKKKHTSKTILVGDSQDPILSQVANENIRNEISSVGSLARKLVIENIRLETSAPDTQAYLIYGINIKNLKDQFCYLCGFQFKYRVSYNHNVRWNKSDLTEETKSYDHTAPVNFSFIVSRIPSEYNTLSDNEKHYLQSNGQYACFHCNYTKSQRMFITCPTDDGKIKFENFRPNTEAITKFIEDLWNNPSDWSLGPKGENTLHECVKTYGGEAKWMNDRFVAIKTSANEVCTMIKKYVDQKNVIKRYYYTKLLIQKAENLLNVDQKYNLLTTTKKKNIYKKKFIAHYVAKAEAINSNFVRPWKKYISTRSPSPTKNSPPNPTNPRERPFGGSRRKRIRKITRKNKRKTYRRIKLF